MYKITSMKILIGLLLFMSINLHSEPLRIAISKGSGSENYLKYGNWLKESNPDIEIIDMFVLSPDSAVSLLRTCSGLLLSGGSDVHPGRFGKEADTARCSITPGRDTLEFALIEEALKLKMPILAICRGEQILNVALGGTLIIDIPQDYPTDISHSCTGTYTICHGIDVVEGTELHKLVGTKSDSAVSVHHQAVEHLAKGLRANAFAPDGIIEGFEWEQPSDKPFMMAVQWHPERMSGSNLSKPLADKFLDESGKYFIENKK